MNARIGIDIGGTFTDVVLEAGPRRFTRKVLTTSHTPEIGVLEAVQAVLDDAAVPAAEVALVIHGTTLATNALIERKGAKTALITTEGFRDTIEIRQENRFEQYDVNLDLPPPLVPRRLRRGVPERIDAQGRVLVPLDEGALAHVVADLAAEAVESVAVGFLHSYVNPDHEERVGQVLAERLPGVSVTLSAAVSPEMREYERFSTACANAYVQPLMARYIAKLDRDLTAAGLRCPLLLLSSGGGLCTVDMAVRFPVRLVESGPAGGAIFASHIATQCRLDSVLSFDMGGTTAKICLIDEATPQTNREMEVARVYRFKKGSGIPLRIPVIDMVEIGAGGGSIARRDGLGRIAVGPDSAGSEPGPACYGRGGRAATVTDADLGLGRIDAQAFSGGRLPLDSAAAERALARLGAQLGLSARASALGVSEMVDENMANAARVHAIESGKTLATRTLIAFGGAAPLHAARVAEKLGIDRVVVPGSAGVGSAIGFLRAPVAYEVVRTSHQRLDGFDAERANAVFAAMRSEAETIVRRGAPDSPLAERRFAFMRYRGQGHEIRVTLPVEVYGVDAAARLKSLFVEAYRAVYRRSISGAAVEVTSWGLALGAEGAAFAERSAAPFRHRAEPAMRRPGVDAVSGEMVEVPIFRREHLRPGAWLPGPAVIVEDETSTVVSPAFTAEVDGWGYLILSRKRAEAET
ncbi:MAG: hydantoinase/oxoprolinase family protein [Alphaproteobacteria bacterium]|nr:hydantoinase/oxoprolinase family protein [Alphaproteobacteria bacterium]